MDDKLQKFAALVEAGSYTKAAKNLHISQPALSVAIAKLEKMLKVPLLAATGRHGLALTAAGKLVYESALEHRATEHNLQLLLAGMSQERVKLRVGMIDSVAALLCSQEEPLRTLEQQTELSLVVANSAILRAAVLSDQLDLAVIVEDKAEDAKLQTAAVGIEKLALVCHSSSKEAFQRLIDTGKQLPFIAYVQTSSTHHIIAAALDEAGITTTTILYSTSPDVMLQMALRGRGATVLPENLVARSLATGELQQLTRGGKLYRIDRRLSVVALKGRKMPPGLAGLAWSVRQQLRSYTVEG